MTASADRSLCDLLSRGAGGVGQLFRDTRPVICGGHMSTDVTRDFAFGLPKAELHLHLEGTLEPDLKLALARKNGVDIGQSTVEEVRATYQFNDLTSFLAVYYPAMDVLQDEDDFHDLAAAYFERARANGVVRAECFFGYPRLSSRRRRGPRGRPVRRPHPVLPA